MAIDRRNTPIPSLPRPTTAVCPVQKKQSQALAYGLIIFKVVADDAEEDTDDSGSSSNSTSDASGDSSDDETQAYSFTSVAAAMYLLVATATPDLRSGFALLVDGSSARHRVFGAALLGVFGLMISAAMHLLSSVCNSAFSSF